MIQEGLLWFDDHPTRPITDKIERAVQRYQQKYGHKPDICYIHESETNGKLIGTQLASEGHPGNKEEDLRVSEDVKVLPAKSVLPHHFWLGIQVKGKKSKSK